MEISTVDDIELATSSTYCYALTICRGVCGGRHRTCTVVEATVVHALDSLVIAACLTANETGFVDTFKVHPGPYMCSCL